MDGDRFDNISRAVDAVVSRRRTMRLLAGFTAAGVAALSRFGETAPWSGLHVLAKKKRKKRKKKRKKRNTRCPGKKDRVCHCPPGNTDNCHVTGNGGGHRNHKLDCCCTRKGRRNPRCSCEGNDCCKPAGSDCANSSQCCDGGTCVNLVRGVGVCVRRRFCLPRTCADFPGQCGPQEDGCGGLTADCQCPSDQVCTGGTCCTPLTCENDFPGQCGTFEDECGNELDCTCPSGGCCNGVCEGSAECCQTTDCPRQRCQERECNGGTCVYTPVDDGDQGPRCNGPGRSCCNGEECCAEGDVCTGAGCCTPATCEQDFPGQCGIFPQGCGLTDLVCTCTQGQCCGDQCVAGNECCATGECDAQICRTVACEDGSCNSTSEPDNQPGTLCTGAGNFCCNGSQCCASGAVCSAETGCCSPDTFAQACTNAGRECGPVADGCGGEFSCGSCSDQQICIDGACHSRGGRQCKGKGLAGHPCKGKTCKCKGKRRCHHKRCCEPKGDGSRHCNANRDCCPGLTCIRKAPGQHKVCMRRRATSGSVPALIGDESAGQTEGEF